MYQEYRPSSLNIKVSVKNKKIKYFCLISLGTVTKYQLRFLLEYYLIFLEVSYPSVVAVNEKKFFALNWLR